jgi:hypothetical protein
MVEITTEQKIIELAESKALSFLQLDCKEKSFNPGEFDYLMKQAIFGFRTKREIKLNERMEIDQTLRAIRMAFSEPKDREKYIRATAFKMIPDLQSRPKEK